MLPRRVAALTLGVAVLVTSVSACERQRAAGDPAAPATYRSTASTSPDPSGAVELTGRRLPRWTRSAATTRTTIRASERSEPTRPRLLFGMGPEASAARSARLVRQAPVRMLTSWYNGPDDLAWMAGWKDSEVPRAYAAGYQGSGVLS